MPVSPGASGTSSFRGPTDLSEYASSYDHQRGFQRLPPQNQHQHQQHHYHDGHKQSQHVSSGNRDTAGSSKKVSPVIPQDHPMPWEIYEQEGITPPPLPEPSRTVFTFTSPPNDGSQYDKEPSMRPTGLLLSTNADESASPRSPGSSPHSSAPVSSVHSGHAYAASDAASTTTTSTLRSPGSTVSTGGFFGSFRPSSPLMSSAKEDATTPRREKERVASTASDKASSPSESTQKAIKDGKATDTRSRRQSIFDRITFDRIAKKVHHRSDSREGRSPAVPSIPPALLQYANEAKQAHESGDTMVSLVLVTICARCPELLADQSAFTHHFSKTHSFAHAHAHCANLLTVTGRVPSA